MKGKVLKLLRQNDSAFLSGEKISNELNCSRTAVWKHIKALRDEGYDIIAVQNKGYQLTKSAYLLSEHDIYSRIKKNDLFENVVYHNSVTSTQTVAQQLANEGVSEGTVVVADEQTGGKGRLGRVWDSEKGSGVWMSLVLKPQIDFRKAPQLTLLTAVAVTRAIESVSGLPLSIKWPNDLLVNGKKLCGILTEMQADPDRVQSVIIGIGLNVNHGAFPEDLSEIATSMNIEAGKPFNRAEVIAAILNEFSWLYRTYLSQGFSLIKPLWEAHAVSIGKKIVARSTAGTTEGYALGIDGEGVLLLQDNQGETHRIYSADIELK
ncbi:biotin--[Salipaludibacillus sp. CUR1]|uniref:biotin--[acetyl-CoA-carboxylase] ligase n=1 Tax=Salipaludibacillus sp. CUR1 TaxID=2820003 RepID=UPI001E57BE5D|nr:biotin--[acetyl-CoA-carboxylase] ligase [Salipaludibacillus sp. CUR1]MCE7792146.1 biotin--[acetyl-CoA-carboxylase] ligase [Salipaludibacillus sp. CUR1]